jgi:leucyl-tRNA synthetase
VWDAEKAFHAEPVARDGEAVRVPDAPKAYVLEMLPYPSGEIHMGHVKNYTMGDVVAHHRRRTGHVVFHPMGYDAFGLPAENAAIRTGEPPAEVTARNIASIRAQLRRLGFSIDWDTEISTADPEYYRWTQWIFLRFLEKGLVERREAAVNWCPADQTVLANEQVVDGLCERCKTPVELRQLPQWFLRITDYAQALLDDMDLLDDWPERVLTMQRNWIGRSVGARVEFRVADDPETLIPVFTTRPDTLHGATFFLLAPEHPLVPRLVAGRPEEAEVTAYVGTAARTAVAERSSAERPKTGVFTGRHVVNPANGEQIPVWVADYVLMDYGTGAIMAVPGHDERDFAFARAHGLPVVRVIADEGTAPDAPLDEAWTGSGRLVNSGPLDGMGVEEAKQAMCAWLAERGEGDATDYMRRLKAGTLQRFTADDLAEFYRLTVRARARQIGEALSLIAVDDAAPVLVHCAAGKDRTGLVVALLLEALGIRREVTVADYALTSVFRPNRIAAYADVIAAAGVEPHDVSALFEAPPDAMRLLLEGLDEEYGSTLAFLRDVAGVENATFDALQKRYLTR